MRLRTLLLSALALSLFLGGALAETLTLTFVGDISIGDAYQFTNRENGYHQVVARNGMDWPFSLVSEVMLGDDLTIANLEGTMTTLSRHKKIRYPLVINPAHTEILIRGGIDIVNTANNHAWDFYQEGYLDTLAALDAAGIRHFGTLSPPEKTGADRREIVEIKGVKIGFMGYTYPQNADVRRVGEGVKALRDAECSLVILSLHWGRETFMTQNSTQTGFAKKAFEAGVDLIYGHHPHVVQPIALYQGKPVFFSTGNFTFGTMSNVDRSTGMFQAVYEIGEGGPVLSKIKVFPCVTSGSGDFRPYPVTDEAERKAIFKKLTYKTPPRGFTALPEGFLDTGEAVFGE